MSEESLKKAIGKIVQDVVYNEDAKPRSVWTDGSPIKVKFAILDEAVDKILSVVALEFEVVQ